MYIQRYTMGSVIEINCALFLLAIQSAGFAFFNVVDGYSGEPFRILNEMGLNSSRAYQWNSQKLEKNSILQSGVNDASFRFKMTIENIRAENKKMDIVFLIDSSSSVGKLNFLSEIRFVTKLLSDFNVSYNYTRVALVSFSSPGRVIRQIDQISKPSAENDKCKLLNEEIPYTEFIGGGTFTYGALKEAKAILDMARKNSTKIVFLVTDGFSNGLYPVPMSIILRENNATIFTIGIQSGNSAELFNISSTPHKNYAFFMSSFFEFESMVRKAFHSDYKTGEMSRLNDSRCNLLCDIEKSSIESCCDVHADCVCDTSSGHYSCQCRQGFYGNGGKGECYPCPNGTYWHVTGICRPCPDVNHVTLGDRDLLLSSDHCVCKKGFRTTEDNRCEGIKCSRLSVPVNGYFVEQQISCANVLNAACGIRCKSGFHMIGTSLRICQENGTWSGNEVRCVLKTCPILPIPYRGDVICKHKDLNLYYEYSSRHESYITLGKSIDRRFTDPMPFDMDCTFKCGSGYYLSGSKTRNCLPLSKWDGRMANCRQVVCPPLPVPIYGSYGLSDCSKQRVPFGTNCTMICLPGFILKGPPTKSCTGNRIGVWTHKNKHPKCIDVSPPEIECPPSFTVLSHDDTNYAIVMEVPKPTILQDNSGMTVSFWLEPSFIESEGLLLNFGSSKFTYIAMDLFNNMAICSFNITVVDLAPPIVENCIDPDVFYISSPNNDLLGDDYIKWDEPIFRDNSGQVTTVTSSLNFGFLEAREHEAKYVAQDSYNNTSECVLKIIVKERKCDIPIAPLNAQILCVNGSNHMLCEATCNEGFVIYDEDYIFPSQNLSISCDHNNHNWTKNSLPDCTRLLKPENAERLFTISVDSDFPICQSVLFLEQLNNSVNKMVKNRMCEDIFNCEIASELSKCSNLTQVDHPSWLQYHQFFKRDVKRNAREKQDRRVKLHARNRSRSTIMIKLYVEIGKKIGVWNTDKRLVENMQEIHFELKKNFNASDEFRNILASMNVELVRLETEDILRCAPGSVFKKFACVQCPVGSFHNSTINHCQVCPLGSFNSLLGQTQCSLCPRYFSTHRTGTRSMNDCHMLCSPGTSAKVNILPHQVVLQIQTLNQRSLTPFCRKCNVGEYQPDYDQVECLLCPPHHYSPRGSKSITNCSAQTRNPCQHRICGLAGRCHEIMPNTNLYSCECPTGFYGKHCELQTNLCHTDPCYNGGACHQAGLKVYCQCPTEFKGIFCEIRRFFCRPETCSMGSNCVETENGHVVCECLPGNLGTFCEQTIDYCASSPCVSGRCANTPDGFQCVCPPGIMGKRCHLRPCDYIPCPPNALCQDLDDFPATHQSYFCKCPLGLKGYNCSVIDSPCDLNRCQYNGQCKEVAIRNPNIIAIVGANDEIYTKYICQCQPYFYGKNCEIFISPNFLLEFHQPNVHNFVKIDGPRSNLSQISFCLWIQTTDTFQYGTIISYATDSSDNMFTFTDYHGFVLYINGKYIVTDVVVNDGEWHFICVAWKNTDGYYEIYLDSELRLKGKGLSAGDVIQANGTLVIGQDQDIVGGGFSSSEALIGKIVDLDIWDTFLNSDQIQEFYMSCLPYHGTLYAWTDFNQNIYGNITVRDSPFCKPCRNNITMLNGAVSLQGSTAIFRCNEGYNLVGPTMAFCLRTSEWSTSEPFCSIITCKPLEAISNGHVLYHDNLFGSKSDYVCRKGFKLIGNTTRTCLPSGSWSGEPPHCLSEMTCKPIKIMTDSLVYYANEMGEVKMDSDGFHAGTFAQIICAPSHNTEEDVFVKCTEYGFWDGRFPPCVKLPEGSKYNQSDEMFKKKLKRESITAPNSSGSDMTFGSIDRFDFSVNVIDYPTVEFWINLKKFLYSGCSPFADKVEVFCQNVSSENNSFLMGLKDFDPPDTLQFENMNEKLLSLLNDNPMRFSSNPHLIKFEDFFKILLNGNQFPENVEDMLRLVFIFYLDIIASGRDYDFLETDKSEQNTVSKLKSTIFQISINVFQKYEIEKEKIKQAERLLSFLNHCALIDLPHIRSKQIKVYISNTEIKLNEDNVKKKYPAGSRVQYKRDGSDEFFTICQEDGTWQEQHLDVKAHK